MTLRVVWEHGFWGTEEQFLNLEKKTMKKTLFSNFNLKNQCHHMKIKIYLPLLDYKSINAISSLYHILLDITLRLQKNLICGKCLFSLVCTFK